ncbi:DUF2510 domain-containing protein [Nocardioides kribbensis]|uniref:DUF2510 domain-containing protein n=1 Tax=Nocardioides kribbensis TaxID=305517 RepID=UPI00187AD496|nr:DUF2510 domain-containing protein [Nocardioides kribbensis]
MSEKAAPGWYVPSSNPNTRRYWDGTRWTDQYAPLDAPKAESSQEGLIAAGWIGLFLLPIAATVIGLVLANRRPVMGLTMFGLSFVSALAWALLLFG